MNSRRFPSFSSSLLDEIYKSFEDDHKKPVVARRSTAEIESRHERDVSRSCHVNYSSYSSCSSNENDTMYGVLLKPKHIRTCVGQHGEFIKPRDSVSDVSEQKPNHVDGKFVKTKSRALKIYSELKKMKKPISPKLSMFFNSIFSTTKNRETEARLDRKSKSANASTCSSTSSFSRSCLSNTPSSKGKSSNGIKRTVRFYVDEDCRPCVEKSLYEDKTRLKSVKHDKNSINDEIKGSLSKDNRRISEAARNLLKNYRKKVECEFDSIMSKEYGEISYDYMSDSSSDLFELDNLKYREELPVYGTTHLDTNRAIANGLVV
ncbi:BIG GRAIN 1-like protein A [Tanacetum coccineum]